MTLTGASRRTRPSSCSTRPPTVIPGGVNTCRRRSDAAAVLRARRGRLPVGPRRPPLRRLPRRLRRDLPRPLAPGRHRRAWRTRSARRVLFGVGVTEARGRARAQDRRARPERRAGAWSATAARRRPTTRSGSPAASPAAQKIVKFQGCYNGFHDYVLRNVLSAPELVGRRDPQSAGMLEAAIDATLDRAASTTSTTSSARARRAPRAGRRDHRRADRAQLARAAPARRASSRACARCATARARC